MRRESMNDNIHFARLRHHRPRAGGNPADRHVRHHMHAIDDLNVRVFQRAFLDHVLRAADGFLRRLKKKHHVVAQARPVLAEPLGKRQQIGHVSVVAAGMHLSRMARSKRAPCFFGNRKRVDIRPESDHAPRPVPAKHGANPRLRIRLQIVRRKRAKLLHQIRMRFMLFVSHLGNLMQRASMRAQLIFVLARLFFKGAKIHAQLLAFRSLHFNIHFLKFIF